MNARTLTLSLALGLAACGGAEEPEDTNPEVTAQATSGEEDTSEASITPPPGRMSEVLTALAGDPLLTVYVDGPTLVDDGPYAPRSTRRR